MKVKVIDSKVFAPGDSVEIRFGVKPTCGHLIAVRIYVLPNPPKGSSDEVIEEYSDKLAKWLSSENMNI